MSRPVDIMTVPGVDNRLLEILSQEDILCETYIENVERFGE